MEHDGNHTEIELKLFIQPQHLQPLITFLNQLPSSDNQGCRQLTNRYFDTPELALRQLDMGLRVRGCDGKYEQTIKTAGKVVGGLHTRPEYNIDINGTTPELALFPAEIWLQTQDISALQQQLHCLFSTDFQRCRWLIQEAGSLIEVALDQGVIAAGENREPLCELEFELISGSAVDLLPLAQKVAQQIPVRLGKASKAQRGYRLAHKHAPSTLDTLQYIELPVGRELKASLSAMLETALERWQLLEDMLQQHVLDSGQQVALWQRLRACIQLLHLLLTQFALHDEVTRKGFAWLAQQLAFINQGRYLACLCAESAPLDMLPHAAEINASAQVALQQLDVAGQLQVLWQDCRYGELQLALVRLLLGLQRNEVSLDGTDDLAAVAYQLQENARQQVQCRIAGNGAAIADYRALADGLEDTLLLGLAFGRLYPDAAREQYLALCTQLSDGIVLFNAYASAAQLVPVAAAVLADEQQSLAAMIAHLQLTVLQQVPYWHGDVMV